MRRLIVLGIGLAALAAGPAFSATAGSAADAQYAACRDKLNFAHQNNLLYDLTWDKGKLPRVVVGDVWGPLPFDAKLNFAKTLECFFRAGENRDGIPFDLLDWQTNKAVGHFDGRGNLTVN